MKSMERDYGWLRVQERCGQRRRSLGSVQVTLAEEAGPCPRYGGAMGVQKTVRRYGRTLEHGSFEARESVHVCLAGCRQPSGRKVTRRAACLADSLPPGQTVGYDVMVLAGLQRFVHHRQREEVREALRTEHGVDLSTGEGSILQRRLVYYLQRLHAARRDAIRQAFARDGGWPLQIDATGEDGRGTLLIAYAGWRRWVLGSWKIPTENADAIVPCLRQVAAAFGPPVAVVRDLGRAMTPAVLAFVDELRGPSTPFCAARPLTRVFTARSGVFATSSTRSSPKGRSRRCRAPCVGGPVCSTSYATHSAWLPRPQATTGQPARRPRRSRPSRPKRLCVTFARPSRPSPPTLPSAAPRAGRLRTSARPSTSSSSTSRTLVPRCGGTSSRSPSRPAAASELWTGPTAGWSRSTATSSTASAAASAARS